MNQILVNQKVYVTPKLTRKKKFYKIQFVLSILVVLILISYYAYSEYDKRKNAAIGDDLMDDFANIDPTTADEEILVVALNDKAETTQVEQPAPQILEQFNTVYRTANGTPYMVDSILNIPTLDIKYTVLSDSNNELLKISLNKDYSIDVLNKK